MIQEKGRELQVGTPSFINLLRSRQTWFSIEFRLFFIFSSDRSGFLCLRKTYFEFYFSLDPNLNTPLPPSPPFSHGHRLNKPQQYLYIFEIPLSTLSAGRIFFFPSKTVHSTLKIFVTPTILVDNLIQILHQSFVCTVPVSINIPRASCPLQWQSEKLMIFGSIVLLSVHYREQQKTRATAKEQLNLYARSVSPPTHPTLPSTYFPFFSIPYSLTFPPASILQFSGN